MEPNMANAVNALNETLTAMMNGSSCEIEGIICGVGTDFVDLRQSNGHVVTVLRNQIKKIHWEDCDPCAPKHQPHSLGCSCHSSLDCTCGRRRHVCKTCRSAQCTCSGHHLLPYIPACHGRVQMRLGGLTGSLQFQLARQKGCKVRIEC